MAPKKQNKFKKPHSVKAVNQAQKSGKTKPEDIQQEQPQEKGFHISVERYFSKRKSLFFILSLILTVVLGIYLFDVKINEGGDDSGYIEMAYRFMKGKGFPTFHGEFYSILMSLPVLIFGVNMVILKIFSFLFILGHLIFFYLTFKNRINSTLLVFTMLIISVSANILFFSSQTYSEALFMFLQSLSFFIIFKLFDSITENKLNYLDKWPLWISTGFLMFLIAITRNIGLTFVLSVIIYFILNKKFYAVIYSALSYLIFSYGFELYKRFHWGIEKSAISQQKEFILLKDPYNAAKGVEDFSGMVTRFLANIKMYFSRHFFASIGLRDPSKVETSYLPAIILIIIFLIGLYFAFRKHKWMLFVGVYLGISIFTTFITLNQSWGQLRLIVVFIPLIILFLSFGIEELSKIRKFRILYPLLLFLFVLIFFKCLGQSIKKASINQKILSKNIEGNMYYGFTPDWVNFLKMSEWVGKNLPKDAVVASRKPSMSFIYSKGKEFYGIYRIPTEDGDSLMNRIKQSGETISIYTMNDLNAKQIPAQAQMLLRHSVDALIGQSNNLYCICQTNKEEATVLASIMNSYGITHYQADTLLTILHKENQPYYGVVPDTLLNKLRQNHVQYVIMASLRINPNFKSANTVNTVQRYLLYIEVKYYDLFSLVTQIGGNEDEPAKLIKLNY